ncbi:MAG: hypothetical protein ABIS86_06515, partial [Streptosporangiaceae bacterium]
MHSTRHGIAVKKAILRRTEHLAVALGPGSPRSQASVPDRLGPRLVGSPIFLMSSAYTDPAPLQILLDGHSMVRSPRGFTLPALEVRPSREYTEAVMGSLGLERPELEHLLWDRLLHHELERSGKDVVVGNVPSAAPAWQRLATVWPDARHLFLISDPAAAHAAALGRGE